MHARKTAGHASSHAKRYGKRENVSRGKCAASPRASNRSDILVHARSDVHNIDRNSAYIVFSSKVYFTRSWDIESYKCETIIGFAEVNVFVATCTTRETNYRTCSFAHDEGSVCKARTNFD